MARGKTGGSGGPAVVIMAGGAGTRFWPASTEARPKQFLRLLGEKSLLQQSYERALLLTSREMVLVLTAGSLVHAVRAELPGLAPDQVIGEPVRRDTAAAVCLAALVARARFGEECVVVTLTADHRIEPAEEFARVVRAAVSAAARTPVLFTLGIPPTHPATGYGYIERGGPVGEAEGIVEHEVLRFREKPDRQTAEDFLRMGGVLWNSGMFVWAARVVLEAFRMHLPGHPVALERAVGRGGEVDAAVLESAFSSLPAVSVDYGLMEKAEGTRVVEAPFEWSDIGGWEALAEHLPDHGHGNRGRGRIATSAARGNLVFAEDDEELVALVGVEGLAVVRAGRRTLVVPLERTEEVKDLVRSLDEEDR